jgi:hypothetical protein
MAFGGGSTTPNLLFEGGPWGWFGYPIRKQKKTKNKTKTK